MELLGLRGIPPIDLAQCRLRISADFADPVDVVPIDGLRTVHSPSGANFSPRSAMVIDFEQLAGPNYCGDSPLGSARAAGDRRVQVISGLRLWPVLGLPRDIRQSMSRSGISPNELLHVNPSRRYLLISPCRDEAQYLRRTLDSVAAQSVQPAAWVVVDDGSTDETPAISGGVRAPTAIPARGAAHGSRPPSRWGRASSRPSTPVWKRCAWRTSTISASWTWIWTCRSATSSC